MHEIDSLFCYKSSVNREHPRDPFLMIVLKIGRDKFTHQSLGRLFLLRVIRKLIICEDIKDEYLTSFQKA